MSNRLLQASERHQNRIEKRRLQLATKLESKDRKSISQRCKKYGISLAEYDSLLFMQKGRCAICGKREHKSRSFHIDHDHKTGRVRGILCGNCNAMLGMAKDNLSTLRHAFRYLSYCSKH